MSSQRRLLVITYHYPPDEAIGGMRWAGFTRYLADLGWESVLVTGISCPRRRTLNDFYKGLRQARPNGDARASQAGENGDRAKSAAGIAQLKFEAGMLLALPDDGRGWILRAARFARQEIAAQSPDVVISSGPPHSAHLAAWLATRGSDVRWIADFRDPWAGPHGGAWRASATQRSGIARWLLPRLERLVLQSADGVLCNTREFAGALSAKYPHATIDWIPNGVDGDALPRITDAPFPGLSITHIGTLYGGRDVEPVLRAMRLLFDAHPDAVADTRLRLAGQVEQRYRPHLATEIAQLALSECVEELGVVPRSEALALSARSRLALVLAQQQDLQVPAKLYELVAMRVPTLVIAESDSASASEARRLGALALEPGDVTGIAAVLAAAREGRLPRPSRDSAALHYRDLSHDLDRVLSRNGVRYVAKRH
jgi:hypothetical protein